MVYKTIRDLFLEPEKLVIAEWHSHIRCLWHPILGASCLHGYHHGTETQVLLPGMPSRSRRDISVDSFSLKSLCTHGCVFFHLGMKTLLEGPFNTSAERKASNFPRGFPVETVGQHRNFVSELCLNPRGSTGVFDRPRHPPRRPHIKRISRANNSIYRGISYRTPFRP